jgi:DNA-binding NtrC family response regulator
VLLVDDEESVLQLEQEILRASGIGVRVARNGQEAINVLKGGSINAIVTDTKMPGGISASDLYQWVVRHHPELSSHIIFTVSDPQDDRSADTVKESGCPVLAKPFQIQEFLSVVQRILASAIANGEVPSVLNH